MKNCGSDDDLAVLQDVTFNPENPVSGKPFEITTTALFKERVEEGYLSLIRGFNAKLKGYAESFDQIWTSHYLDVQVLTV